jgi:hypothetical protein
MPLRRFILAQFHQGSLLARPRSEGVIFPEITQGGLIMGIWLNAWAGDNAGLVMGRQQQPYRALVAYTKSDFDHSFAFLNKFDLGDGTIFFAQIEAICLTAPNAMDAIVTKADLLGSWIYSLELTPVQEKGKIPWNTGVHLFGITI